MIAFSLALMTTYAQQATQPEDAPIPFDQWATKGITPPKVVADALATYSDEALKKHINGLCLVLMIIDTKGMPQDIKVGRCLDSSLEQSSLTAAAKYRFRPATTKEGKPIAVRIGVWIHFYRLYGPLGSNWYEGDYQPPPVRVTFTSPPGITSSEPGADGVYPLTKTNTPPTMTTFSNEGYGQIAFYTAGDDTCNIALTISAKGKPSDPQVIHCDKTALEKPAVASLLKSQYKAGRVNGKAVPMRASVRLEYGDAPASTK
jgi:hypothetical protein